MEYSFLNLPEFVMFDCSCVCFLIFRPSYEKPALLYPFPQRHFLH